MHKCEHNEKDTTDPWKNLPETQPPSLIINGDKVSSSHWPPATEQLFIFHLSWWPRSLLLCFSSKSARTNQHWLVRRASFQKQLGVWRGGGYSEVGEVSRKKGRHIFPSMLCPNGIVPWVKIIFLYYCFLKVKVIIDIGGLLSETTREEKLLGIRLRLKIVKLEYAISYLPDYNKTKFI